MWPVNSQLQSVCTLNSEPIFVSADGNLDCNWHMVRRTETGLRMSTESSEGNFQQSWYEDLLGGVNSWIERSDAGKRQSDAQRWRQDIGGV
jgi:hypothetical protein